MPGPTGGEWTAHGRGIFSGDVMVGLASHPRDIEETPSGRFPPYDACLANAQLMASAPKFLAALRQIDELVQFREVDQSDPHVAALERIAGIVGEALKGRR